MTGMAFPFALSALVHRRLGVNFRAAALPNRIAAAAFRPSGLGKPGGD